MIRVGFWLVAKDCSLKSLARLDQGISGVTKMCNGEGKKLGFGLDLGFELGIGSDFNWTYDNHALKVQLDWTQNDEIRYVIQLGVTEWTKAIRI